MYNYNQNKTNTNTDNININQNSVPPFPPGLIHPNMVNPYVQMCPMGPIGIPIELVNRFEHLINSNINLASGVNNLMSNVIGLGHVYQNNTWALVEQINLLKKNNEELQKQLIEKNNLNKSNENSNFGENNNKDIKNTNLKNINPYHIKSYYPNNKSWTDEKIKNFLSNLNSIKDILGLKYKFYYVRHNKKMAKLCNLIPSIEKLDKMIGLEKVKSDIFKIIIYYIQNPHTNEYLHTVITGPPGVGKTEIAKIYADIFVRLGILKTNKFVEIKRDDLVAKYLGQTAPKTRELLESAMGGVIFLDEGYSLGNEDKQDSFSKEAIDMINQYLSERKKDFMFVIAGYEEDLEKCFFSANRGLKRRFGSWLEIKGYDKKELVEIFKLKVKEQGYVLDEKLNQDNKDLLKFFDLNYSKFENFAGDVEKFINYIKYEQSFRTFKANTDDKIIIMEDLNLSLSKFKNTKKYEIPFGLYV